MSVKEDLCTLIHEIFADKIVPYIESIHPMVRVYDYPRWYAARQRELEEVFK